MSRHTQYARRLVTGGSALKRDVRYVKGAHGVMHAAHRQGDEWACSCGKRWPNGEEHP